MKRRLLIAGGTGLIGSAIKLQAEEAGWEVLRLSRSAGDSNIRWDPASHWIDINDPLSLDAIINLAGSSLADGRWTRKRMHDIRESRIHAAATLEKYLAEGLLTTPVYIGASAIGVYGDTGDKLVNETTPVGYGLHWLADTVMDWESAHERIQKPGIRTIIFRIGLVLSGQGGAFQEMLRTRWLGIIPYFGNGKQLWSWIHIHDLAAAMLWSIDQEHLDGICLAVAPQPVTNKAFSKTIARTLWPRRFVVPVPRFILAILLGKMHQMLLDSMRGYPSKLIRAGYAFRYPVIQEAVQDLLGKTSKGQH